jgi:hypothetical protein
MFLSNEAMLNKDNIDATKFKASKGRLGLANIRYHLPPLAGMGQFRFALSPRTFYQKITLCQLTLRKYCVNVSLTTSYSAIAFLYMTSAVTDYFTVKAQKESHLWLRKCPLLLPRWPDARTSEATVL